MQRISVIGTSGSGKTTVAREIARRLGHIHIDSDSILWQRGNWEALSREEFAAQVAEATLAPRWVYDGNNSATRSVVWSRADTIVWLDLPLYVNLWRIFWRSLRRALTREELWGGNRETLRQTFFSSDSMLLWVWRSHPRRKREYPQLLARPEYAHLQLIHLKSQPDIDRWLASLGNGR